MNKQLALAIKLNDEATLADFNWGNNGLLHQQIHNMLHLNLNSTVESTASTYCTDSSKNFDDFLSHRMGDTPSIKNHQNSLKNQHISHSRYDSTAEFRLKEERLLYLWGPKGSGKSHLLQACCQAVNATQSAMYLPLALLNEWGPQVIEGLEEQALICIDDINIIANNAAWEEALFHLYNKIKDKEKSLLIISGDLPPSKSGIYLPDLRSRLSWGLVIQLNELSDDEKISTLIVHALKRGIELPVSVGQFLLNRCSRNMHDLHQLLNHLDDASLAAHRKITIPFVKDILNI